MKKKIIIILILFLFLPCQLLYGAITDVVINEINVNAAGTEPDGEYIELYNTGSTVVDISDCWITDGEGDYIFPAGTTIAPYSAIVVYGTTYNPDRITSHLFLANSGDQVQFYDSGGGLIDSKNAGAVDNADEECVWYREWDGGPWAATLSC